jgi:hypothetical protein
MDLIELKILKAFEELLTGPVNELLQEAEFQIAPIELDAPAGVGAAVPVLRLTECERTEKERIIQVDAYTLTITLTVPDSRDSERDAYAYGAVISQAVAEDSTLGGVADRAALIKKVYTPPKHPHCGELWELSITLRITIEEVSHA